jgi:glutamate-1-semialdehyde 2,1-aminomutase
LGIPGSPGVPEAFVQKTLSLPYNDAERVTDVISKKGDKIAAVIVEPVAGNMGLVPPDAGFLNTLRSLTQDHGIILIFDEVMTGFRVAYGGAQALYDLMPDLTCMGKVIGGGLPVGAYGGRKEIMKKVAPEGPVYQAGTLSGNPLAMAAGIATLKCLQRPEFYETLEARSAMLETGIREAVDKAGVSAVTNRVGSMLGLFFTEKRVSNFAEAQTSDLTMFAKYFKGMLERGIYLAPSQYEALFVSSAHSEQDVQATTLATREVFDTLREFRD